MAKNENGAGAPVKAPEKMSRTAFEEALEPLQVELVKMQEWVKATGAKVCVIFEGRDTAGKGGIIADVRPALHAPPAGGRRSGAFRPQLV
jgi:polyphosphate kinase 2 (PPK2 family)